MLVILITYSVGDCPSLASLCLQGKCSWPMMLHPMTFYGYQESFALLEYEFDCILEEYNISAIQLPVLTGYEREDLMLNMRRHHYPPSPSPPPFDPSPPTANAGAGDSAVGDSAVGDAAAAVGEASPSPIEMDASPASASLPTRLPAVIAFDLPESEGQGSGPMCEEEGVPVSKPQGLSGPSVVVAAAAAAQEAGKCVQKRKVKDGDEDETENAPSPKEQRMETDSENVAEERGDNDREMRGQNNVDSTTAAEARGQNNVDSTTAAEARAQQSSDDDGGGGGGGGGSGGGGGAERMDEGGEDSEGSRRQKEELMQHVERVMQRCHVPHVAHFMERIRLLPREGVEKVRKVLRKTEATYARALRGDFFRHLPVKRGKALQEDVYSFSDEESDEEEAEEGGRERTAIFSVSNEQRLLRCLVFGSVNQVLPRGDQGRGYEEMTQLINAMIDGGEGEEVVRIVKDVSVKGRSSRQDLLIFVLAKCCRSNDLKVKRAAYAAVQDICRIPTHIFQFIQFIEAGGKTSGWGRGLRKALTLWYNSNASNPMHLAMHITKYWNRHGWNHRDIFRLLHIKPVNEAMGFILRYAVKGMAEAEKEYLEDGYLDRKQLEKVHKYLKAVEEVKKCEDVSRAVDLIQEHNLLREQLRTELLNSREVWSVMLPSMPLHALLRNLNKMTAVGLLSDPEMEKLVIAKISNAEAMKKARMHPLKILLAHHIYHEGKGEKGSLQWEPVAGVVAALDRAFYEAFALVEPTHQRILIALDISGSMGVKLPGYPVTIREAATVMAMVTLRNETHCDIVGFHQHLIPLEMFKKPGKTLDQLVAETSNLGFGNTDCSKPMTWARKHGKAFDAFIIYTDNETNYQRVPPYVALEKYRQTMGLPAAKLVVVGMCTSSITIAQPGDLHMLDVVGFDPDTPEIISDFLTGGVE